MTFWSALTTAWHVGRETSHAVTAAQSTVAAGGGPLAALRAFAAATDGQLDDEAVAALEAGLRKALTVLAAGVTAAAWVAEHEPQLRQGLDTALGTLVDVGYAAGRWQHHLRGWLDE